MYSIILKTKPIKTLKPIQIALLFTNLFKQDGEIRNFSKNKPRGSREIWVGIIEIVVNLELGCDYSFTQFSLNT